MCWELCEPFPQLTVKGFRSNSVKVRATRGIALWLPLDHGSRRARVGMLNIHNR